MLNQPLSVNDLLCLIQVDNGVFRGDIHKVNIAGKVYGGQLLAQSVLSAQISCPVRMPHSMHAYFLRAGDPDSSIDYRVTNIREGKSFSVRQVDAIQNNKTIFSCSISFHKEEEGFHHQHVLDSMPPVPTAFDIEKNRKLHLAHVLDEELVNNLPGFKLFTLIPGESTAYLSEAQESPCGEFWFKANDTITGGPAAHYSGLSMASDMGLITASLSPHPTSVFNKNQVGASLDHAIWFHEEPDLNDWLLYKVDSPWAGNARGFNRGSIFDSKGLLIASVAQEGLIRRLDDISLKTSHLNLKS